jgi:hypothetical protein
MRTGITTLAVICIVVTLYGAGERQSAASESSPCAMVQQALSDSRRLKVGITRGEVEKYFIQDGGLQFAENTRYVYPKCDYIKLEVDFSRATSGTLPLMSPNDTVTKVGKLFIEYPARD